MMLKKFKVALLATAFLGMSAVTASATYMAEIHHNLLSKAGNTYTFGFTVENESTGSDSAALDAFMINLDAGNFRNYSNMSWVNTNSWATQIYSDGGPSSDWILPASFLADDSIIGSNGGGITQGGSLGNFRVSFDYSGTLDATQELFSYLAWFGTDANGNATWTSEGFTQPTSQNPAVPEPTTMLLMGTGIAGLIGAARRKKSE